MRRESNNRINRKRQKSFGLSVEITENMSFEKALRLFKKKVDDSGILKEVRDRQEYIKPKTRRKMARNAARKRWLKYIADSKLPEKQY